MSEPTVHDFNDDPGTPMAILRSEDLDHAFDPTNDNDDACVKAVWDE
jgi:hypothetical protein